VVATIGGATPLAPGATVDDGLLDVAVSIATGPLARAAFAAALPSGRHVERDDVMVVRGREVAVTGGPVDLVADGELEEDMRSRTWRVQRHAWSVLVPRRHYGGNGGSAEGDVQVASRPSPARIRPSWS
jgi:diacylglycerol kinase family enzyme